MPQQIKEVPTRRGNGRPKAKFGVIGSFCPRDVSEIGRAFKCAESANTIEIRLDLCYKVPDMMNKLVQAMRGELRPIILTLRSKEQGGHSCILIEEQWKFWTSIGDPNLRLISNPRSNIYVDWGLDMVWYAESQNKFLPIPWDKVGVSQHNVVRTPDREELMMIYNALHNTKAKAFIKLVTTAIDEGDITLISHLFKGRKDPRPLIAFTMGETGKVSRYECLSWGSAGTYGYIPGYGVTAPGQVSIHELMEHRMVRKYI